MRALIVDDSTTMRKILINTLSAAGVTDVVEACDGQQAVDAVMQDEAINVVLMDWNMPNMLGIDALKLIRSAGKTVPVIMVTAEADKARVLEAFNAGANNFIVRPFKTETLITKIQETVPMS